MHICPFIYLSCDYRSSSDYPRSCWNGAEDYRRSDESDQRFEALPNRDADRLHRGERQVPQKVGRG